MSFLNPIGSGRPIHSSSEPKIKTDQTAQKVARVVEIKTASRIGLNSRKITPLQEAKSLYQAIKKNWDVSEPKDLAKQIDALEEKVSKLNPHSLEALKIKEAVEKIGFRFVFPLVEELVEGKKSTFPTFAQTILKIAKAIEQLQSAAPLNELSFTQRREIYLLAEGESR